MERTPHQLPKNPGTHIETTNLMQVTSAELSGLGIEEWITNYASDFRTLIEKCKSACLPHIPHNTPS